MAAFSSVNDTVRLSPGASITRPNPFSSFIGRSTGRGGCRYNCTTSAPVRDPLFRTLTLTLTVRPAAILPGEIWSRLYSNVVYDMP